jgi:hypothetical protein
MYHSSTKPGDNKTYSTKSYDVTKYSTPSDVVTEYSTKTDNVTKTDDVRESSASDYVTEFCVAESDYVNYPTRNDDIDNTHYEDVTTFATQTDVLSIAYDLHDDSSENFYVNVDEEVKEFCDRHNLHFTPEGAIIPVEAHLDDVYENVRNREISYRDENDNSSDDLSDDVYEYVAPPGSKIVYESSNHRRTVVIDDNDPARMSVAEKCLLFAPLKSCCKTPSGFSPRVPRLSWSDRVTVIQHDNTVETANMCCYSVEEVDDYYIDYEYDDDDGVEADVFNINTADDKDDDNDENDEEVDDNNDDDNDDDDNVDDECDCDNVNICDDDDVDFDDDDDDDNNDEECASDSENDYELGDFSDIEETSEDHGHYCSYDPDLNEYLYELENSDSDSLDPSRLSLAEKMKLFSERNQEKPPPKRDTPVARRKQRRTQSRFATQVGVIYVSIMGGVMFDSSSLA